MKTRIFIFLFSLGMLFSNFLFAEELSFANQPKKDIQSIQVYPNPINEKGSLKFTLEQTSAVSIEFYDISGKKVKEIKKIFLDEGEHKIEFKVNELEEGIYVCKIKTNSWEKAKRIIITR